ncbi:hypothetical protein CHS0354_015484 [Potamilus streckersoni]|uniref:DNA replication ATP-dependent helicase/nuclease n=1 Tax=Potamilus streckersoni TaxID=2493646 RepID=A0AAE0SEC6_9BIVA|nr:hypothetical protein CHS0354_015484 [Potamilus streckersoni]
MGKIKRNQTPQEDCNQMKISSFFQPGSSMSDLFTKHGDKTEIGRGIGKPSKKRSHVNHFNSDKESSCSKSACVVQSTNFQASIDKGNARVKTPSSTEAANLEESILKQNIKLIGRPIPMEDEIICNTQLETTPAAKGQLLLPAVSPLDGSKRHPKDCDMIPDTPNSHSLFSKTKKKPPVLGRSFLCSRNSLFTNPIQQAKENRDKLKMLKLDKKRAPKTTMGVSVTFSSDSHKEQINNEKSLKTKDGDSYSVDDLPPINIDLSDSMGNESDCKTNKSGETPTKVYNDGTSAPTVKRMAKQGISPDTKRNPVANVYINPAAQSAITKKLDFPSLDEQPDLRTDIKDREEHFQVKQLKDKSTRFDKKMIKYQLMSGDMNTLEKDKTDVSVNDDEVLGDLLKELHTADKSEFRQYVSLKSRRKVKSSSRENAVAIPEWTDSDESYFSKLGIHAKVNLHSSEYTTDRYASQEILTSVKPKKSSFLTKNIESNSVKNDLNLKCVYDAVSSITSSEIDSRLQVLQSENDSCIMGNLYARSTWTDCPNDVLEKIEDINLPSKKECDSRRASHLSECIRTPPPSQEHMTGLLDQHIIETYHTQLEGSGTKMASSEAVDEMDITDLSLQNDSWMDMALDENFCEQQNRKGDVAEEGIFQSDPPCLAFGRHVVTEIHHDRQSHEVMLVVTSEPGKVTRRCVLQGFWADTHVSVGNTVHILAVLSADDTYTINDTQGLLVVNPDLLLSGTSVVSSVFCMRKSVLNEKFKGCDSKNVYMLYGSVIHALFQEVLRKQLKEESRILEEARNILQQTKTIMEMYGSNVTEANVMEEIKKYLPQLIAWTKQHTNIYVGQNRQRSETPEVLVTNVQDIEENIWSPRYGIKGKIDLTVEVKIGQNRKVLPLELKTGKASYSVEHKGQVTLYSMMSSDRREDPGKGLLLYLKEPSMKIIPADYSNQRGLLQLRNEMAYYQSQQVLTKIAENGHKTFHLGRLPDPISNIRACQKCPQLLNCAIYQQKIEQRLAPTENVENLLKNTLSHLETIHLHYFSHWCLMLDLERQRCLEDRTTADLWCLTAVEREMKGDCLSGMILAGAHSCDNDEESAVLEFHRHAEHPRYSSSLLAGGILQGESIVISQEKPSWIAVSTGYVQEMTDTTICVIVDRDGLSRLKNLKSSVFRIDKYDMFNTSGIYYTNLSRLMSNDTHSHKLRKLIIEKVKPQFLMTLSKSNIEKVKPILKPLNKPQKTAILKVLMSKDYVLIKGYPGTGKTSTIVSLVKALYTLGLSVLLTSYTHSAVDNILLKLLKDNVKFVRLGRTSRIHPDIQPFSVDQLIRGMTTTAEVQQFFDSQMIVATSCLGTSHPLFVHRKFDVCIVDEASQVLQPACLGPLFYAERFILVGDPKQLAPVVQSKEARTLGMDDSLFSQLDGSSEGVATFELDHQYRMNREIMNLSNKLVYNGCLKCGSVTVETQTLSLPRRESIQQDLDKCPWLKHVTDTELEKAVVFLDTERIPAPEIQEKGGGIKNEVEAMIVMNIVKTFIQAGINPDEIGIIAPYRSQVHLIKAMLQQGQGQGYHMPFMVEVNTVDQYQGRDKSIILTSFVRSSLEEGVKTGELLKDIRRLNVSLTRAKHKLVLIGNASTLNQYEPLARLLKILQENQQISFLALCFWGSF